MMPVAPGRSVGWLAGRASYISISTAGAYRLGRLAPAVMATDDNRGQTLEEIDAAGQHLVLAGFSIDRFFHFRLTTKI